MEQDFLKRITEITEANLGNHQFGVDDLAREMKMSHSSLFRRLNAINGKSINQFIREIRLWKAMELMQEEGMTASEAAYKTGFSSAAYFSNCFHEFFGYPPGEAKSKNQSRTNSHATRRASSAGIKSEQPRVTRGGRMLAYWSKYRGRIVFAAATSFILILFTVVFLTIIGGSEKPRGTDKITIAVLPFEDWGTKASPLYIIYGFKQDLITDLSEIKSISVQTTINTEQYKNTTKTSQEIGREVNADYLLRGAIGFEGEKFKLWIQLVNARTGTDEWSSDTVWNNTDDLLETVGEITKKIAGELKARLSPEEIRQIDKKLTENMEAYRQYKLGQFFSDGRHSIQNLAAMEAYKKAIELDPRFTEAYLGLAGIYLLSHALDIASYQETVPLINWAIGKAKEIDPKNPAIESTIAWYNFQFRRVAEAREYFEQQLRENPLHGGWHFNLGKLYRNLGEWEKAKGHLVKSVELNPKYFSTGLHAGLTFDLLRDYPEAIRYYDTVMYYNPRHPFAPLYKADVLVKFHGDTAGAYNLLVNQSKAFIYDGWDMLSFYYRQIWICFYEGRYEKALDILKGLEGHFPNIYLITPVAFMNAMTYRFLNKPELERKYWDSTRYWIMNKDTTYPDDPRPMSTLGIAWAGLGNKERAVELGEKALEISPRSQNLIVDTYMMENLAQIYTMVGKYPEAIKLLRQLLAIPSRMNPKLLAMDPRWIPLRKFDGFQKLMNAEI